VVVGGFVINHLPDPQRALAEAARVLVPGGEVAFSVWDRRKR
jgi:ubiquinone/menaquinone biosynthesis C-methylase UbiE